MSGRKSPHSKKTRRAAARDARGRLHCPQTGKYLKEDDLEEEDEFLDANNDNIT